MTKIMSLQSDEVHIFTLRITDRSQSYESEIVMLYAAFVEV